MSLGDAWFYGYLTSRRQRALYSELFYTKLQREETNEVGWALKLRNACWFESQAGLKSGGGR